MIFYRGRKIENEKLFYGSLKDFEAGVGERV
jgi:hypothetical protein